MHFTSVWQKNSQNSYSGRRIKRKSIGALMALLLGLGSASSVYAVDGKSYPGSMCQTNGSSQSLTYGGVGGSLIANRTNLLRSAACPIVRDNVTDPWLGLSVRVRDRHDSQNVTCVAHSRNLDATSGWQQTRSTAGEGFQTLNFTPIGEATWGAYTLLCQLPAMQDINQPSYISTYFIREP